VVRTSEVHIICVPVEQCAGRVTDVRLVTDVLRLMRHSNVHFMTLNQVVHLQATARSSDSGIFAGLTSERS
jgi:hypothetical protein